MKRRYRTDKEIEQDFMKASFQKVSYSLRLEVSNNGLVLLVPSSAAWKVTLLKFIGV
jgi:hypothetical protein